MAVTSIPFAFFTILTVIAYYAFPKRNYSWIVLLIASSLGSGISGRQCGRDF